MSIDLRIKALLLFKEKLLEGLAKGQVKASSIELGDRPDLTKDETPQILHHFSKVSGLNEIHPKHQGTGVASGGQYKSFNPSKIPDYPHTSFHYIDPSKVEPDVLQNAKSKYTVKLSPQDSIYDVWEDPQGLVRESIKNNQGIANTENILNSIKGAGHAGLKTTNPDAHPNELNTIQLFHPRTPDSEEVLGKSETLGKTDNIHGIAMASPNDFSDALKTAAAINPHIAQNVEMHQPEDLSSMRTYLSADKKSGYAIKPDGELTSVFSSEKGRGPHLVSHAIDQGAHHLNAFEGKLTDLYGQQGFKEYSRDKNWTPGGPDVVFMKLHKSEDLQKSEDHGLCTMFLFDGVNKPDILHITHKYFGKDYTEKDKIIETLEMYFDKNPFKEINESFDEEDWFGKDEDVRVLRPKSNKKFLLDLKDKLDELKEDKWPIYKPHVTVSANVDKVDYPIVDYVLVKGGKVLWSANKSLYKTEILVKAPFESPQENIGKWTIKGINPGAETYHKSTKLPNGLYHHIFSQGDKGFRHVLSKDKLPTSNNNLAEIDGRLTKHPETKESLFRVGTSSVDPNHMGHGYGKMLMGLAAKHHGGLVSDKIVSPKARAAYESFKDNPEYDVQIGKIITDPDIDKKVDKKVESGEYDIGSPEWVNESYGTPHYLRYTGGKAEQEKLAASEDLKITFSFYDDESEILEKTAPEYEGQAHPDPSKPWVAKTHPGAKMLMWHSTPEHAQKNDATINNPGLVQNFLNKVPETHRPAMKHIIAMTQKDPYRHFIPSADSGKQKLRARHIKSLLYGDKDITMDTSIPGDLTITRNSHSTNREYPPIPITYRFGAGNAKKSEANDGPRDIGSVHDVQSGTRPEPGIQSGRRELHLGKSEELGYRTSNNGSNRNAGTRMTKSEIDKSWNEYEHELRSEGPKELNKMTKEERLELLKQKLEGPIHDNDDILDIPIAEIYRAATPRWE